MQSGNKCGFTLIELLAVMLIMAIITGITIVGFTGVTRGAAAMGAARDLQQTIRLARQYAVTQRIPVAVIICDANLIAETDIPSRAAHNDLIGRAYAVYDLRNFKYLKPWTLLPRNMVFDNGSIEQLGLRPPPGGGRHVLEPPRNPENMHVINDLIPFPMDHSTDFGYFFGITFGPDGNLRRGSAASSNWHLWLIAFEGGVRTGPDGTPTPFRRRGQDGGSDIVYGIRVSYAGAAQMIELEHVNE